MKRILLLVLGVLCLSVPNAPAEQTDAKGCKDHPLFTRMPGSWIYGCIDHDYDVNVFSKGNQKTESVEGHYTKISYYPTAGATKLSVLQIMRNYENAVKQLGGTAFGIENNNRECFRIVRNGRETWVDLRADFTGKYSLVIVERQDMVQDVVANAASLADGLRRSGHVTVNGIFFDTGKTELKPESEQAIAEVAKLLQADPALKLYVVGHTDNVGTHESNAKLSQGRADAVVQSLVGRHGIAAARLRGIGVGPVAPASANDTEEGRAQNRRVELAKQ